MNKLSIVALTILAAGILFSADNFTDNGNGTVTDNNTKLIWQKCSASVGESGTNCSSGTAAPLPWENAVSYCKDLTLGERKNWRLPHIKELFSIMNYEKFNPTIDLFYFPNTIPSSYWSSNVNVNSTDYAWVVAFSNGMVHGNAKTNKTYIRCVSGP